MFFYVALHSPVPEEKVMLEPDHVASDLPDLDRAGDPRGGAVAWALLTVGVALTIGIVLVMIWIW